jgi:hypothetical protein
MLIAKYLISPINIIYLFTRSTTNREGANFSRALLNFRGDFSFGVEDFLSGVNEKESERRILFIDSGHL